MRKLMTGVGYRRELGGWIASRPAEVDCVEVTAEHFFHGGDDVLAALRQHYRVFVHGLGLSLGTPGPLDTQVLDSFADVVRKVDPDWISEHIAFTRTAGVELGHLNPVPPTSEMIEIITAHAREVSARCGKPIILENITSHVGLNGDFSETDFLNKVCERAGCGLLLDVTNLFINSRNHGFDPLKWLREIEPAHIVQLHIVGYSRSGARYVDSHSAPIQEDLIDLAAEILGHAEVKAIVLERDEEIHSIGEIECEMAKLHRLHARC